MLGFGNGHFGQMPFGAGEPEEGTSLVPNNAIRYIDPTTKDFVIKSDGSFQEMPNTRQRVLLALTTTIGTMAGNEGFGSRHPLIGVIDSQFNNKVNNSVREALRHLIEIEKVITLDGVDIDNQGGGRVVITVSYTNLNDQDQDFIELTL